MRTGELIAANDFCKIHHIEYSFIGYLEEAGLVNLVVQDEQKFIHHNQLSDLEKIIHLYTDLDVNIAGIEVIFNMLKKIERMQQEIILLKNKIDFYR